MNTVGQLKDSMSGILTGVNLDRVTGLNKAIERAARKLLQKADVPEASATQAITLYDGIYDYRAEDNIFGGAILDLRPQGNSRHPIDTVIKRPIAYFDRNKHYLPSGYEVAFEWNKGVPIVRIATPYPTARVTVDGMAETTDWTAGGSLSALAQDATVYYEEPSSLRFTLTGSSTGTLTKTLGNALSISSYENVAVAFLAIRIPDGATASNLTSIALKLGSDASNYDEVTTTTGYLGAWTAGEWLLVALDMSGATSTGAPDWTAIDYVQLSFAHTATFTNFRVGGLWLALPSPHEFLYQTAAIFLKDGALKKTITTDDDQIILSDASYVILEHEAALGVAVQKNMRKKAEALRAILYGGEERDGLYSQYRADNPSDELRTVGAYYEEFGY